VLPKRLESILMRIAYGLEVLYGLLICITDGLQVLDNCLQYIASTGQCLDLIFEVLD
jgi:hypothetical protein